MSKITNKWDNMSAQEKKQAYEQLKEITRMRQEKENKQSIEDRIKDIKRIWLGGI